MGLLILAAHPIEANPGEADPSDWGYRPFDKAGADDADGRARPISLAADRVLGFLMGATSGLEYPQGPVENQHREPGTWFDKRTRRGANKIKDLGN